MAPPAPDAGYGPYPPRAMPGRLTFDRIWAFATADTPGRLAYALRMAAGCSVAVLLAEVWQVPDLALVPVSTMALWQRDRVGNVVAALGVNILVILVIFLVYWVIRLTLDHPVILSVMVGVMTFIFHFLGSASKLKPVAYLLGFIFVYATIAISEIPVGEIISRALLYVDLFVAVPGLVMIVLGLLICPSPKTVMTQDIAARLRMSAAILRGVNARTLAQATDLLREGAAGMMKNATFAGFEKMWSKRDLSCLRQAANASVGVLSVALNSARYVHTPAPAALIDHLDDMASIFECGDYPTDTGLPHDVAAATVTHPALSALPDILETFTAPEPARPDSEDKAKGGGFFVSDAFTNPDHVRYAVKGTAAVMTSYILFKLMNWPGVHTCIITCFIVAQPTVGEMISKLTLRISGTLVGGVIGIAVILFLMPHLQGITAFLAVVFGVSLFAAWVKAGDARVAYAGFQVALAFYLCDLSGYGPTTDMATARDRIVGILIGNFITFAMFTSFWPETTFGLIPRDVRTLIQKLQALGDSHSLQEREARVGDVQTALSAAERTLEFAAHEPVPLRADDARLKAFQMALNEAATVTESAFVRLDGAAEQRCIQNLEAFAS